MGVRNIWRNAKLKIFFALYFVFLHLFAAGWWLRAQFRALVLGQSGRSTNRLKAPCAHARLRAFARLPGPTVWIHAASLGEVKAARDLLAQLQREFPHIKCALSTLTQTGYEELQRISAQRERLLPLYLPIDLPRYLRPLVGPIAPQVLIVVEGDVWLNFLRSVRSHGAFVTIVSGKVSARSARRLQWVRSCLTAYWSRIDLICAQSIDQMRRLLALGVPKTKLQDTGNLKLDQSPPNSDEEFQSALLRQMRWIPGDVAVLIASTHAPEELRLVRALWPLMQRFPHLHLVLAPRHPERFLRIAAQLEAAFGPITLWSKRHTRPFDVTQPGRTQLHLIDALGHLSDCYRMAKLAIVGGSFVEGIGGHNLFESIHVHTPVLFGPYMAQQNELAALTLRHRAGLQIPLGDVQKTVERLLEDEEEVADLQRGCARAVESARGTLARTWLALECAGAFRRLSRDKVVD